MALIVGAIGGSSVFTAAKSAQPPIDWSAIPFVFVGCAVGTSFVIGIQIFRSKPSYGQFALRVFEPLSVLILGSGISAFVISAVTKEIGATGTFFLAIGFGLVLGVVVSSFMFYKRFKTML